MSNRDCTTDQLLERLFATVPEVAVVGSAADGREAVTLADQTAPDVVLMDIWHAGARAWHPLPPSDGPRGPEEAPDLAHHQEWTMGIQRPKLKGGLCAAAQAAGKRDQEK